MRLIRLGAIAPLAALAVLPLLALRIRRPPQIRSHPVLRIFSGIPATNIRALDAVSDSTVWAAGSGGYVGRTLDGGAAWRWTRVGGSDTLDLRSLAVFDSLHAVVANAGFPASIYRTVDGGAHWTRTYFQPDSSVFIDGIRLRGASEAVAYGDPVPSGDHTSRFLLLRSRDRGAHWHRAATAQMPRALAGEVSFAASNSGIATPDEKRHNGRRLWLVTGGSAARVLASRDFGKTWQAYPTPMIHGKASTGVFSIAFHDQAHGIIVGGDYRAPAVRLGNAALSSDGGKTWQKPLINPLGYRSCVLYLATDSVIATGPSGTDISLDGGLTWQSLNNQGFNVLAKAPHGRSVFLAGARGKLGVLSFSTRYSGSTPPLPQPGE